MVNFKKIISIILIISFIIPLTGCRRKVSPTTIQHFCFDTYVTITIYDKVSKDVTEECIDICNRYELIFSRTNPKSELYRLNNGEISSCSDDLIEAIRIGLTYSQLSKGAFDITIAPLSDTWKTISETKTVSDADIKTALGKVSYKNINITGNTVTLLNNARIDLGSIAKGLITDRLEEFLISKGIKHAIINLGGNIGLIGGKSSSDNFTIGIQKPFTNDAALALDIKDYSIVSTGIYERNFYIDDTFYHHIINPKTGYPYENDIAGVTIISKESILCDTLSTVTYCLGIEKGIKLINETDDTYAVFIKKNGDLVFSEGFRENINFTLP